MKKQSFPFIIILLLITLSLGISACSSTANVDIDATVQAALLATQAAQPTNTATPEPTDTPTPTSTPTPLPTDTPEPTATNTPSPTATNTSTPKPTATNTPEPTPTLTFAEVNTLANTELDYKTVNRSDKHIGEIVCWKGEVFNLSEEGNMTVFQAWYFTGRHAYNHDDAFVVVYPGLIPDVFDETEVIICGKVSEKFSGTNALGGQISQPSIIAQYVEIWTPPALPTPTPMPKIDEMGVQKQTGNWGMKLYDVKRAKAVYYFGTPEIAQGVWFMPFVEFTNLSSGTLSPWDEFDFYLYDDQGRSFDIEYNSGTSAARWQYQAGDYMDNIQPGSLLGIVFAIDAPEDLGDVWLRIEQDPNFAIYLGNASTIPLE